MMMEGIMEVLELMDGLLFVIDRMVMDVFLSSQSGNFYVKEHWQE